MELFIDDKFEEEQELWFKIIELLISFVGTMQQTHDFELYAYEVADNERKFKWILYSPRQEIPAEKV